MISIIPQLCYFGIYQLGVSKRKKRKKKGGKGVGTGTKKKKLVSAVPQSLRKENAEANFTQLRR